MGLCHRFFFYIEQIIIDRAKLRQTMEYNRYFAAFQFHNTGPNSLNKARNCTKNQSLLGRTIFRLGTISDVHSIKAEEEIQEMDFH